MGEKTQIVKLKETEAVADLQQIKGLVHELNVYKKKIIKKEDKGEIINLMDQLLILNYAGGGPDFLDKELEEAKSKMVKILFGEEEK